MMMSKLYRIRKVITFSFSSFAFFAALREIFLTQSREERKEESILFIYEHPHLKDCSFFISEPEKQESNPYRPV